MTEESEIHSNRWEKAQHAINPRLNRKRKMQNWILLRWRAGRLLRRPFARTQLMDSICHTPRASRFEGMRGLPIGKWVMLASGIQTFWTSIPGAGTFILSSRSRNSGAKQRAAVREISRGKLTQFRRISSKCAALSLRQPCTALAKSSTTPNSNATNGSAQS